MVSTLGLGKVGVGGGVHFKNSCHQGGIQFSYEIILGGYSFHTRHFSEPPPPPGCIKRSVPKPTPGVVSYNVQGASNNVFVTRPGTEAAKRAFRYRGAVMWNGLENELKDEINLNSFKSALSLP